MAGTGITYGRNKVVLWTMFGPLAPLTVCVIAGLVSLGAPDAVIYAAGPCVVFGWIFAAARLTTVPVEVSLSGGGLRIRSRRGGHVYKNVDQDIPWSDMVSAAYDHHQTRSPKAWLQLQQRRAPGDFALGGDPEAIRSLEQSIQGYLNPANRG